MVGWLVGDRLKKWGRLLKITGWLVGWCQAQKMRYTIEKHRLVGRLVTDSKNGGHYSKSLVGWCKAPKLGCTIEKHRLVGWLGHIPLRCRMVQ